MRFFTPTRLITELLQKLLIELLSEAGENMVSKYYTFALAVSSSISADL